MSEKIAFVSWDFIELICHEHSEILALELRRQVPLYVCRCEQCSTQLPASVYEKILNDIVLHANENIVTVGGIWRKKYAGKTYEFKVLTFTGGKKIRVSVKCLR